jgi:peroxiredoxin-like protein
LTLHHFHLTANWPGGRNHVGTIETKRLQTKISIPPEMDGPGIGTNPDEMLLGAAATCYIITLAAMLERSQIQPEKLELQSEGIVDVTNGVFTYKEIIHRPYVQIAENFSDDQLNKVHILVHKAEKNCMISQALAGNVILTLEANVQRITDR